MSLNDSDSSKMIDIWEYIDRKAETKKAFEQKMQALETESASLADQLFALIPAEIADTVKKLLLPGWQKPLFFPREELRELLDDDNNEWLATQHQADRAMELQSMGEWLSKVETANLQAGLGWKKEFTFYDPASQQNTRKIFEELTNVWQKYIEIAIVNLEEGFYIVLKLKK